VIALPVTSRATGPSLPALTGARFFAAISVVVYHFGLEPLRSIAPLLVAPAAIGPAAVSFFYVLSGAVLTWGCTGTDGQTTRSAPTFWAQRASRILPAYILAIVLCALPFVAHVLKLHPGLPGVVRSAVGFSAGLLLLQAFWPPLTSGLNTPGWSISCEAFFYLLWPRLNSVLRSARPGLPWRRILLVWLVALVAPCLGLLALYFRSVPVGPFATLVEDVAGSELLVRALSYFPPLRLPEFVIGIVLGHALRQTPQRMGTHWQDTIREFGLMGGLIACAFVLGTGRVAKLTGIESANHIAIEGSLLAPLFALIIWQLARGEGWLQHLLSRPTLLVLGDASYALYVLQEPVVVWFTAALKRFAPDLIVRWNLLFWVYASILVVVSVLVHRYLETPLRLWLVSRWVSRKRASLSPNQ